MALIDYTTYDEVRAVLGVSDEELGDGTLGLSVYSINLNTELDSIDSGLAAHYTIVKALSPPRTAAQQKFFEATSLFATYAVAKQLSSSLPLFSPKDISDGKASIGRFSDSPYKATIKSINEYYEKARQGLDTAYGALVSVTSTAVVGNYAAASSPSSDPVTGT